MNPLEGEPVELTPADLIGRLEEWVRQYPQERERVAAALSDSMIRLGESGPELRALSWSEIGAPAERAWLLEQWLPAGCVAMLTGEGGVGKSRLALQLAAGLAAERPLADRWIAGSGAPLVGTASKDGGTPVLYATWEDRIDEMGRRLAQISGAAAEWCQPKKLNRLRMVDLAGHGPLWAGWGRHGMPELTPLGYAVRRLAEEMGAGLLVLDSLAAVYGANENDRAQVRGFMASWDAWAGQSGCAVLVIGHPPKSSFGYSGSTDWHSASRARWELEKEPSGRRWKLAVVKSNYGPEPPPLYLVWDAGGPRWAAAEGGMDVDGNVRTGREGNQHANLGDI